MSDSLGQELVDAGIAIGMLSPGGGLNGDWFKDPSKPLAKIFSNPDQRSALLDLLDQFVPPSTNSDIPSGEKWHPLLGNLPSGNLYLTVKNGTNPLTIGLAGEIKGGSNPAASLRARLPIVSFTGSTPNVVAGTVNGPLDIQIRVELNLTYSAGMSIGLKAISLEAHLAPIPIASPHFNLSVLLEGLDLGSGPVDTPLDSSNLAAEANHVVIGLLHEALRDLSGATGEAAAVVAHLLPLFGLGSDGIPLFPFTGLLNGPSALQGWLNALVTSGKISAWLGHLAGLFGSSAAVAGSGTQASPWRVPLFHIDATGSALSVTLASVSQTLQIGVSADILPAGLNPPARFNGSAVIAGIPLAGTGNATVLPSVSLAIEAPGSVGKLVSSSAIAVDSARAGIEWNGSKLQPLLELVNVALTTAGTTTHYAQIDLTNTDSVEAAAAMAVKNTILAALGNSGPAEHIAALVGLVSPAGDASWPFSLNLAKFVANPVGAIAEVHRQALLSTAHNWGFLLAECAGLVGIATPVSGTGTLIDPWRVTLAEPAGPLNIELAAWNDQTSGIATDPQKLRLGLRASANSLPWQFFWAAELLAFDLPGTGSGNVSLMAGQHASFLLSPCPQIPPFAGITIAADSLGVTADWVPGGSLVMQGVLKNITVTERAVTKVIGSLHYPPTGPFDISNPGPSLGITTPELEFLVRLLFTRAVYSWSDMPGLAACVLLGIHGNLPGLQMDWPTLADPGSAGSLFTDPLSALRNWLLQQVTSVSSDGTPFLPATLSWLAALIDDSLPPSPTDSAPSTVAGSGLYEDPWHMPLALTDTQPVELLVWLEPAGPPVAWASKYAQTISATSSFSSLLSAVRPLGSFFPQIRQTFTGADTSALSDGLSALSTYFSSSDGVVPFSSQVPTGGLWTAGTALSSAHPNQPKDPSAISQVLAKSGAWAPAQRAVLLLGPSFSDHTVWQALLTAAEAAKPGSTNAALNFNLRIPNIDPSHIDLNTITGVADFYTADLQDDGSGDVTSLSAQIGLLVARLNVLRPGANVILAAHSTAGVAARVYAHANPAAVAGLITIGTPHLGAPLDPLVDPSVSAGLRFLAGAEIVLPAGPLADAVGHLQQALDGYLPPAAVNGLPVFSPYPIGSFQGSGSTDTATVPALAIGGALSGSLLSEVRSAFASMATTAAAAASAAPTHLSFGFRTYLALPAASAADVNVSATVRVDASRIALKAGAANPARALHSATFNISLDDPSGWLAGKPNSFVELGMPISDVRVRRADMGVTFTQAASSTTVTPFVHLHQAAFHGPTTPLVQLTDVKAQLLLGAILHQLATPQLTATSPAGALLGALSQLGLAVPDPHGGTGFSADAYNAILVDPVSYFAPRIQTALNSNSGLLGISSAAANLWTTTVGAGPLQLYIANTGGWQVGIRVPTPSQLTFGGSASLAFDLNVSVASLVPTGNVSFDIAGTTLTYTIGGALTIAAPPWLDPLPIPPSVPALEAALENAIPRILLSSAVTALLEALLGPLFKGLPIDKLISSPGKTIGGSGGLGNGSGLDSARITSLLQGINTAIGSPDGPGLTLPAGLQITATGTGTVAIGLSTTAPIGGVVGFALNANVDPSLHVTPSGTLSLTLALPGTWGTLGINFAIGAAGVSLQIVPGGSQPIQLLPTFSGLGSLAGNAAALLPQALDALAGALPASPVLTASINLAQALNLHDATSFSSRSAQWKQLLQGNWLATVSNVTPSLSAIAQVINSLGVLPGTVKATSGLTWTIPFSTPLAGNVVFTFGGDLSGPNVSITGDQLKATAGPLELEFSAGISGSGAIQASLGAGFNLESSLGIAVVPKFSAAYGASGFAIDFTPLGTGTANILDIQLAPTPTVVAQAAGLEKFIEQWILPIAGQVLLKAAQPAFAHAVWPSGPKLQDLLTSAGILTANKLTLPLPPLTQIVTGLLGGLVSGTAFQITSDLSIAFVSEVPNGAAKKYFGLRLAGFLDLPGDSITASLRFGKTVSQPSWLHDPNPGLALYLFDSTLAFNPKFSANGFGLDFTAGQGQPLINTSYLRTGHIGGYVFFELDFAPTIALNNFGAGMEIDQFGIPLGQALGSSGGNNPVASSLVQSDGSGDSTPVAPAIDLIASYQDGVFDFRVQNQTSALWLGIHQQFGPIYIDQIGLEVINGKSAVALLVDGSVQLAGLTVQADELGVVIPLKSIASPGDWSIDLKGLAVSYDSSGVVIEGGLIKNPGPPVEYDGMLSIQIAGKGFTAIGAYAKPSDNQGSYTSLFIFVSLPIVLGGPPFFFVTGLGGGAGINRRLIPPSDITQVPNFPLVEAINDPSFGNNPMGALQTIAASIPARRGSYWFAAGIRFDSFVLVHSTAVIYVALDGGFEIGILGVSRLALPTADVAIVSVELALKIRFSTAEGILSVQAQLTDNSYILSKDCQLTGGFAFFVWFPKGQFVITIGGYHPAFQKPTEFPTVPRVGFHWAVSDFVVVKGEAYFALTNSCVMAGGRLEATAHLGPARAWFIFYADFLISWHPFYYDIDLGVSIGVSLDFEICFFVCGHVHLEVSIGASLHILGPPFHGTATVHVLFFSITIPFGPEGATNPPYIPDFGTFEKKYLSAGDPNNKVVAVRVKDGLLPTEPPGATPNPGSLEQPWTLSAEFSFISETRMPASTYSSFVQPAATNAPESASIDLAAMDKVNVGSNHTVAIYVVSSNAQPATDAAHWNITYTIGLFPEATWHFTDPTHMPAAARTLPAISGLTIQGVALLEGRSNLIPIAFMVDDLPWLSRPLPFDTLTASVVTVFQNYGLAADSLGAITATVSSAKMLKASEQVLSGAKAGFASAGLSPLAVRSLRHSRSAPPLVAPLTTGLTMKAVGLAGPPAIYRAPAPIPVALQTLRLRAVLQRRPQAVSDAPVVARTTVITIQAALNAPRTVPPPPISVLGARLHLVPALKATRPTQAAIAPRILLNPEIGILTGRAHTTQFQKASAELTGDGVTLPSGTTHVWDLPAGADHYFAITGSSAVRIVAVDRGGKILMDSEMMAQLQPVAIPANAVSVIFQCLGNPPTGFVPPTPGFGAISFALAPQPDFPAVGWQSGAFLEQVGPQTILSRGSSLRLPRATSANHNRQRTSYSLVRVSQATLDQSGIETQLPGSTTTVMILLDGQDPTAATLGDLAIAAAGATLVTPPIPIGGGRRRALLYDVKPSFEIKGVTRVPKPITISAGSKSGWQISGIVGLHGSAAEWAVRFHGKAPERVIAEGPLTPNGSVRIRALRTPVVAGAPILPTSPIRSPVS